ncbi:MAG: hypothetical protein C5B54_05535, partial [Acidobacteria bacterium]
MKDDLKNPIPSSENSSIEINQEIISLDDFCSLANKLVEQSLFDEAITLYQTASKIFPESLAIKLNLGRVQELSRKHALERQKSLADALSKAREKEDMSAHQYLSLATLYYSRRKMLNAIELLELSKYRNENLSKTRYLLGKIYYEQGDPGKALEEFLKAKELDPFYEDIYKHLGAIYHERKEHEKALEAFIDAYILSGGEDVAKTSYYQRQIRSLLNELNIEDRKKYNRFFNEKKQRFLDLANSLSVNKAAAENGGGGGLDQIFLKLRELERV